MNDRCWAKLGLCLLVLGFFAAESCLAGLVASEVIVVVNGSSTNSRTIANHYTQLREIPSINVIVLDSVPNSEVISVEAFRERILKPLVIEIGRRGLASHVQCIAYSADFPTAIDIKKDLEPVKDLQPIFTPMASINGLTYLYELALVGNPAYIAPDVNYYARRSMDGYFSNPGGVAFQSKWQKVAEQVSGGQYDKAVASLNDLARELPHQYPIRYLAAAQAAQADQPDTAVQLLQSAINGGWTSGGYLARDKRFDSIRGRDDFQVLELLLDSDLGQWQPTIGFNNRAFWAPNGVRFLAQQQKTTPGMRYLLSTVLAVTRGAGTTPSQAVESLKRAATADSTHPDGGFYYSETGDIRSQTRKPLVANAIAELKELGFQAEIVRTPLPMLKSGVLGAHVGTAQYDWNKSSSNFVPGSLFDNLTSFGGVMTSGSSQTKLTEAIKAGAAGSSGTVTEPFALPFKFPDPYLFVHYARGSCLAEAFYQSVTGPYQLLIVGDPLCQPFSHAPSQEFDKSLRQIEADGVLQFELDLTGPSYSGWLDLPGPHRQKRTSLAPARIAVQVNGKAPRGGAAQSVLRLEMAGLPAGYHEVQLILIADDPLNQRSVRTIPVWVGPPDLIQLSLKPSPHLNATGEGIHVSLQAEQIVAHVRGPKGATQVSLWCHAEQVATTESSLKTEQDATVKDSGTLTPSQAESSEWEIIVPLKSIGMGPVRLQAKATLPDGSEISGLPQWIVVVP